MGVSFHKEVAEFFTPPNLKSYNIPSLPCKGCIGHQKGSCELPRIRNARLRVGLHPLWGALPPRRVHAAPTPAYTSIQGYSGATFSLHTRQPTYPPLAVGIAGWSLLFTPAIGGYVKLLILKQNFNLSIAKNCLRRRAVSPYHR